MAAPISRQRRSSKLAPSAMGEGYVVGHRADAFRSGAPPMQECSPVASSPSPTPCKHSEMANGQTPSRGTPAV